MTTRSIPAGASRSPIFFSPAVWGRGYASELLRRSLEVARAGGVIELVAFAHPDNAGSRRVLVKAGFRPARYLPELERDLFTIAP